jgi:ABC-type lipoprotein export system ATPase subunit/site-specific DNA-cytosine methylase
MKKDIRIIDMTFGLGGMSSAFVEEGFEIVAAINPAPEIKAEYKKVMKECLFIDAPLDEVDLNSLPYTDILIGQAIFSRPSRNKYQSEDKNYNIYNIIKQVKPNMFLLEMGIGLLIGDSGKYFKRVLDIFNGIGYRTNYKILEERDFSGFLVNGKRGYLIGVKENVNCDEFYFPSPKYTIFNKKFIEKDVNSISRWYRQIKPNESTVFIKDKFYMRTKGYYKIIEKIPNSIFRDVLFFDVVGLRRITHNEYARMKGLLNYNYNDFKGRWEMYNLIYMSSNKYVISSLAKCIKEFLNINNDIYNEKIELDTKINKTVVNKKVVKTRIPKLRITNIYIDELKGLKNLDIEITKNLTAIMGVNGCGKSTLLHALACIYRPYEKGEDYKFSFFFTPNPDSNWKNSKLIITQHDENTQKEIRREYKKEHDRWAPRYGNRLLRDVYYLGIATCIPEIEIERQTSYIDYSTSEQNEKWTSKVVKDAAYILNKPYDSLTIHNTKKKTLIGIRLNSKLIYSSLSMGAGEQRVIRILNLVYSANQYSLILIDEIDLLLHATALKRLICILSGIATKRNLQIIFTSHAIELSNLTEYVSIRYLEKIEDKILVYKSINSDLIYELTEHNIKPLEIYVEDTLAELIIKRLASDLNMLSKIKINKFGAATNAFVLAASFLLKGENVKNTLIVLDGDVYSSHVDKISEIKKVFSGTEEKHDEKIKAAIGVIKQFSLPLGYSPEKYLYELIVSIDDDRELIKMAKKINAVSDSHEWLNTLVCEMGDNESFVLNEIVDIASNNTKWGEYVAPVREWLIEKRDELNV